MEVGHRLITARAAREHWRVTFRATVSGSKASAINGGDRCCARLSWGSPGSCGGCNTFDDQRVLLSMAVFSDRMVPEKVQVFWAALQAGEFITAAAARAGTYREKGYRWIVAAGGVRPRRGRHLAGRYLSFGEREGIALGAGAGGVAAHDRGPAGAGGVDGVTGTAPQRRRRGWLPGHQRARAGLPAGGAPETGQACHQRGAARHRGRAVAPAVLAGADRRPVAPAVPGRPGDVGVHRDDLPVAVCAVARGVETRVDPVPAYRALRHPGRKPGQRRNRIPDMVNISQRPAEAADRAVPGHWEGDRATWKVARGEWLYRLEAPLVRV
jgi:IS30 family transposase